MVKGNNLRGKILEKHEFGNFEKFGKRLKMLSRALRNTLNPSFKDKQYYIKKK